MGVAAAAVVAVVGMATPLALQLTAPPSVVLATPEPTPAATALVPDPCRDPLTGAEPLVDGDLPDGATRAWLCGRSDTGSELELVGAPDPLVAHAQDAVAAFNALGEVGEPWMSFYVLGVALEVAVLAFILRSAWTWPRRTTSPSTPAAGLDSEPLRAPQQV